MAVYGSRDKNPFNVPKEYKINGVPTTSTIDDQKRRYYTTVDSVTGETIVKSADGKLPSSAGGNSGMDRIVGTIPKDGVFKPTKGTLDPPSNSEIKYFTSAQGQKDVKNHAVITAKNAGAQNAQQLIFPNSATPGAGQGQSVAAAAAAVEEKKKQDENSTAKVNEEELKKEQASAQARKVYPDLQYPETLSAKQDCIQFKILKSEPRPLGATAGISGSRSATSSRSVGRVRLPISGPVSDSNRVRYGEDSLTPAEAFFETLARSAVTEGAAGAGTQLDAAGNTIKNNTGEIKTAVANEAVKAATGINALTRRFGLVVNPNMELLFNSPELRSFSFTFRLTPRSEDEAIIVRKIIRLFKQGMSVQRTKSQIYLKTPNSFEIQYLTGGKPHPYLPKIKECALTDCSVNYAPDGTYMTYSGDETSMTAYDLTLQFSELEPIFNDEYTELDGDKDTLIGY